MTDQLKILVVDDNRMMAKTLKDILGFMGHHAMTADCAEKALETLQQTRTDFIISDIRMPGMGGVGLYQQVSEKYPLIPLVLMTAYTDMQKIRKEISMVSEPAFRKSSSIGGFRSAPTAVLTKPLNMNILKSFLSFLSKGSSIIIVDDDPVFSHTIGEILTRKGFSVVRIPDAHQSLEPHLHDWGVVLLDMKLNEINGLEVLRKMRKKMDNYPVILVSGYCTEMENAIHQGLECGALACFEKPVNVEKLVKTLSNIRKKELVRILFSHGGQSSFLTKDISGMFDNHIRAGS